METTPKQDLAMAKGKHYLFKSKMRAYLDGSREVEEAVLADYNACALGKWVNEVGKVKFAEFAEVTALDLTHQKIHGKANEIIRLKKEGNDEEAEKKMLDIEEIGAEIIHHIEILEEKLT